MRPNANLFASDLTNCAELETEFTMLKLETEFFILSYRIRLFPKFLINSYKITNLFNSKDRIHHVCIPNENIIIDFWIYSLMRSSWNARFGANYLILPYKKPNWSNRTFCQQNEHVYQILIKMIFLSIKFNFKSNFQI